MCYYGLFILLFGIKKTGAFLHEASKKTIANNLIKVQHQISCLSPIRVEPEELGHTTLLHGCEHLLVAHESHNT